MNNFEISEVTTVRLTNGVALGGITLPAWWPTLLDVSTTAGAFVPILSALWLILQIWRFLRNQPDKKEPNE